MANMKVNIAGVELNNPIITASGTYGFGREYSQFYSLDEIGAVCAKGLTLAKKLGNPSPRIAETPMGILNSVGLQNPGVDVFIKSEIPFLRKYKCKIIANIAGSQIEDYVKMAEILDKEDIDLIEMNISCPNVKEGGVAFGTKEENVYEITSRVKEKLKNKPLIVKLSPNVTDIVSIAKTAEKAGADALSLINTLLGMRIDINTKKPILHNNVGGLSGPAVMPIAVRMVWQVANAVDLPIIGMGGVMTGNDAAEFMIAGASAVAVGSACFVDPYAPVKIKYDLEKYLDDKNITDVNDIVGSVIPY